MYARHYYKKKADKDLAEFNSDTVDSKNPEMVIDSANKDIEMERIFSSKSDCGGSGDMDDTVNSHRHTLKSTDPIDRDGVSVDEASVTGSCVSNGGVLPSPRPAKRSDSVDRCELRDAFELAKKEFERLKKVIFLLLPNNLETSFNTNLNSKILSLRLAKG